jgi:hypothetical protein
MMHFHRGAIGFGVGACITRRHGTKPNTNRCRPRTDRAQPFKLISTGHYGRETVSMDIPLDVTKKDLL